MLGRVEFYETETTERITYCRSSWNVNIMYGVKWLIGAYIRVNLALRAHAMVV